MPALNTDLYQLTMAAGYFAAQKTEEIATFELIIRRLPDSRNFMIACGLQQALEYLRRLSFLPEEIDYLRSLQQMRNAPHHFFDYLANLRFTGSLYAVPEGTPVFPNEPIAIVRAPIIQAQLVETYLLSTFAYQTSVASKAIRCAIAAKGRPVVEFGSRRAHTPEAGIFAGRAAYIGGCAGTSNTETGHRFDVPVFGTSAHSWTMSFGTEESSFRALQDLLGDTTVFLVDTYDTLEGVRNAVEAGRKLRQRGYDMIGIRLDSGDLAYLSIEARKILDAGGFPETAVLHYKPAHNAYEATQPDFFVDETDAWIVYPWDVGEANLPAGVLESLSEA